MAIINNADTRIRQEGQAPTKHYFRTKIKHKVSCFLELTNVIIKSKEKYLNLLFFL